MKTPRFFVARLMTPLLLAVAVVCVLFAPTASYALDHPTSIVKDYGPYMGDPDQPSSPYQELLNQGGDLDYSATSPHTSSRPLTSSEMNWREFVRLYSRFITAMWRR